MTWNWRIPGSGLTDDNWLGWISPEDSDSLDPAGLSRER